MKTKILGILVMTLLIATAVLPAVGTMNELEDNDVFSTNLSEIEWEKTYGGDEADKLWDVQETDDGGYIACGTTEESNNHCPWVLRVDSDGNEMWDWTITGFDYGGTYFDITYCWCDNVRQTADGGYIVGITSFTLEYNDEEHKVGGLLKLDSDGAEEWMNIFGDPFEWTIFPESIMVVDGGFMGVGAHSPPLGEPDMGRALCVFKTDSSGELIWHQAYRYSEIYKYNWARGFCSTDDGGYLIVGDIGDGTGAKADAVMVKTDSNGNEEWDKTFGGSEYEQFGGVFQTNDGGYMMGGYTNSFGAGSGDVWLLRTDATGNEIWNKTFGEKRYDLCFGFDSTDDGGYIFPVRVDAIGMNTDSWALKVDSDGNAEWKHIYGESGGAQHFIGICSTSDGGCIASGISGAWDSSKSDALLVKYAPMENQRPNKPATPNGPAKGKPDTEYTFSTSSSDPDGDSLQYMWDWGDGEYSDWLDTNEATYTWTTEDNFEIRVKAMDEHGGESVWSDPLAFSTPKNKAISLVEVSIIQPWEGTLYLWRMPLPILQSATIIIGNITVLVSAISLQLMDKLEFYVDDELKYTETNPAVSWQLVTWDWDEEIFFKHTLKVVAYDKGSNTVSDEIDVWIFNM